MTIINKNSLLKTNGKYYLSGDSKRSLLIDEQSQRDEGVNYGKRADDVFQVDESFVNLDVLIDFFFLLSPTLIIAVSMENAFRED